MKNERRTSTKGHHYTLDDLVAGGLMVSTVLLAGCNLEPDYEEPTPFCHKALQCWSEADGDLQREAECKWAWPTDWQWAEAAVQACGGWTNTCVAALRQCSPLTTWGERPLEEEDNND